MLASDKTKTRVGAVALGLAAALTLLKLSIGDVALGEQLALKVEFDHVGALQSGADVQIAGRVVGEVKEISLGKSGAVAHLSIDGDHAGWIDKNASVFVASKGLLSNRYIEIGPPLDQDQAIEPIADGAVLRGVSPVRVEIVVLRSVENTRIFRELLIELRPAAAKLVTEIDAIAATLEDIEGTPGRFAELRLEMTRLFSELSDARTLFGSADLSLERLTSLTTRARRIAAKIGQATSGIGSELNGIAADIRRLQASATPEMMIKLGIALARAGKLAAGYQRVGTTFEAIASAIERGEGTVGALLHDPEFIDEAKQLGRIIKRQPWRLFGAKREKLDLLEP